jgi:hypothetical protein
MTGMAAIDTVSVGSFVEPKQLADVDIGRYPRCGR